MKLSVIAVAVASVVASLIVPAAAQQRRGVPGAVTRDLGSLITPNNLRLLAERAPAPAFRRAAANATLFKACSLNLGEKDGLRGLLSLGKDNIGPFGVFEFFDPEQTEHFELVDLVADLTTVNIKRINKCVASGSGDWGKVNVRSGDPGRKRVERQDCIKFVSKRAPWSGRVVFKAGLSPLGAGKFVKTSGKVDIVKVVSIDGCEPPPPPTDCDFPTQLAAQSPDPEAVPGFFFLALKDTAGEVVEITQVFGFDAGTGLPWFDLAAGGTTDPNALTGDSLTRTGTVVGVPPFTGTGNFNGTTSESAPVECGGTTESIDGSLTGDLSAGLLMGDFGIAGPAAMFLHTGP